MNFQPKYYKYILSFLIGIGFLGYQYHSNRLWETSPNVPMPMKLLMPPVETIIPAEIDEQFTTWYLGQTAVDLPDAYQYYFDYNIRLYPKAGRMILGA